MTNLVNGIYRGKARFALNPLTGLLFDYATSRDSIDVAKKPTLMAYDGTWDLVKVKLSLENPDDDIAIEDCLISGPVDKVDVANQDFAEKVEQLTPFERAQKAAAAKAAAK